jgi:Ca2+-transporting ATPase
MGTLITYGRGKGLVTCTGMNTQIGLIAQMIQSFEDESTPLQKKLEHLGKVLGTACLAICAIVFIYGLFRDTRISDVLNIGLLSYLETERKDIINLFMTAVSLAIAAVPEGLPAIVTICLAIGMQRMIKHHALIRKLPAVETLGCATVICSDKTGTLTQNQMTVVQAWARSASTHARIRMRRRCCRGLLPATTRRWRNAPTSRGGAHGTSSATPRRAR